MKVHLPTNTHTYRSASNVPYCLGQRTKPKKRLGTPLVNLVNMLKICLYSSFLMVCLGFEPGAGEWKAQKNLLCYDKMIRPKKTNKRLLLTCDRAGKPGKC